MAKGICSVDGCEKPARSRGWCNAHYERWRKSGITPSGRLRRCEPSPPTCAISTCDATPVARGWCSVHYGRWQATGDPLLQKHEVRSAAELAKGERTCGTCDETKVLDQFPLDASGRNGLSSRCKTCHCDRVKQRRADNGDEMRRQGRERYWRNPQAWIVARYKKNFGLTWDRVVAIFEAQDGRCLICKREITKGVGQGIDAGHLDHCHTTGEVRGFLCSNCNKGLGMFADDPERLEAAANYLRAAAREQLRAV